MRKVTAIIVALMSIPAVAAAGDEIYLENLQLADTCYRIPWNDCNDRFTAEICGRMQSNREGYGLSRSSWSLQWLMSDTASLRASVEWGNTDFGGPADVRYLDFKVVRLSVDGREERLLSRRFTRDVSLNNGDNVIVCEFAGSCMRFFIGNDDLEYVGAANVGGCVSGASVSVSGKAIFPFLVIASEDVQDLSTTWTVDSLTDRFLATAEPMEGFWDYVDRDNDTDYARLGGNYRLALVADGQGGYDIIYVSQARVNADKWRPGMLKGRLAPTIFRDRYDLEWFDAMGKSVDSEMYATVADGRLLTLHFPIYKSRFRFALTPLQPRHN